MDATLPAPGSGIAVLSQRTVVPREVDLFMFSAAIWLTHRIHYDREYARSEGYSDLLVPGPLQSSYIAQMLGEVARRHGGRLSDLRLRHRTPVYCGEQLELISRVVSAARHEGAIVVVVDAVVAIGERVATDGNAQLVLPDLPATEFLLANVGVVL